MTTECPECGDKFKQVGYHWGGSECSKPTLDIRQKEISIGLLMGDAWVEKSSGKGRLRIEMTNKRFIDWLNNEFGIIVSNLSIKNTASEAAEKNKSHGYDVNEENYNTSWILSTRTLNYFSELRKWYETGVKRFPEDLELKPLILKVWYCCDGSFVDGRYPVIYSANENDRRQKVINILKRKGFSPSFTDGAGGTIQFKSSETENFFKYIGQPLPGFEYKWPEEFK